MTRHARDRFLPSLLCVAAAFVCFEATALGQLPTAASLPGPAPLRVPALIPPSSELERLPVDAEIARLVDELGHPEFFTRRAAMSQLRARAPHAAQLAALMSRESFDAERRFRLLQLLREIMIDAPRGALGIRMDLRALEDGRGGVEITDLIEGMPALHVLEVRDRITQIEGVQLRSSDDLIVLIQTRRPGEVVRLRVERPRRTAEGGLERDAEGTVLFDEIELEVELGSSMQLLDPTMRGPTAMSPVVARRTMEWEELVRRHAPKPVQLLPEAEAPEELVRSLFAIVAPALPSTLIDEHEIIQALRREIVDVIEGRRLLTEALVDRWRRTHADLLRAARMPDLAEHERDFLTRLADRYEELLRAIEVPR